MATRSLMSTRSVLIAPEGGGIHSMKTKRSAWTPSSDFDAVISSYEVITKQQTIAWVAPLWPEYHLMPSRSVLIAAEGGGIHSMKTKRSAWTPSSDFDAVISSYEVITKQQTIACVAPLYGHEIHTCRLDRC